MPQYLKKALTNEISIMKSLNHPNIVKLIDIVKCETNIYLIMEHCETDLENYLKKNKLSEDKAIYIFKQIIEGITIVIF